MLQSRFSKMLLIFSSMLVVVRSYPQEAPAAPAPAAPGPIVPAPVLSAPAGEPDLKESADEAIGDRIMEEMNGMKV